MNSDNLDELYIQRLKQIVLKNLNNEQFGVNELALQAGQSRSQLHRKTKIIKNQSPSKFIRNIRLEEAYKLLKNSNQTASEVAYNVGFANPSYFNSCFHEYYGFPPGEVKKNKETQITSNSENKLNKKKSLRPYKKWVNISISLLFFAIIFLLKSSLFSIKTESSLPEKSIAVLPLKNISDDEELQCLSVGIMEDILNRLSHVHGIKVKSRLSVEKFSKRNITIPELGRMMDVSYILEGSIFKEDNQIRIYFQLIRTDTDNHIWSKRYDQDCESVFSFVSDISELITNELKIIITPNEIKQIEKIHTTSAEAYKLYQKGRFFWHKRTEEDLIKSLSYFNMALKQDSSFALAYAGLADAYFKAAWWRWLKPEEAYHLSKSYSKKALSLDYDLAEAHATLGAVLCWHDHRWKVAEDELLNAIKLNPGYADGFQYCAEYFDIIGNREKAREHIETAIELDPSSEVKYYLNSLFFYNEGNLDEAISQGELALEFDDDFKTQYLKNFLFYSRKMEEQKAIDNLLKFLKLDAPAIDNSQVIFNVYNKKGLLGVIKWTIENRLAQDNKDFYYIAQLYALIQDKDSTIEYLQKAYYTCSQISRIKNCYDFKFLANDPEFKGLLKKLNLSKT